MAYRPKKDEPEAIPGMGIFQEVSGVKIQPGLGIFEDPNQDLTPDADGKIPIHTRASESFELTRFRATKARIGHFIQENAEDLKDSRISPESMALTSIISAGFFTEKALREFMGDAEAEDYSSSAWESGKGWVTKKSGSASYPSSTYTPSIPSIPSSSPYLNDEDDWDTMGYGGGYGTSHRTAYSGSPIWSSSGWAEKPKPYRTLSSQLKSITDAMETEMQTGALRSLENPADLTRVILLKVLKKIDVMDLEKPPEKWEVNVITSSIMGDIRWDLGYAYAYEDMLKNVRMQVEAITQTLSTGVRKYLTEAESPERLMVDFSVLVDVETEEPKNQLKALFAGLEELREEGATTEEKGVTIEGEFDPTDIDFGDHPNERPPTYQHEDAIWGRLRIIEHPLIPNPILRKRTVTYKPTDIGAHLGQLDRILTDKRIFKEMRPTPTGSLLVDCSGSMGLSSKNVYDVLENVPGAVIGIYSGNGGGGVLHIIARGGKVAANLDGVITSALRMGGNVVDGPSLEWLATMPKPRIWYSDGQVTGLRDGASYGLKPIANAIMKRGGIGRIGNQKKVPAAFRHMRKEKTVGTTRVQR